jgi:hypothetical protein
MWSIDTSFSLRSVVGCFSVHRLLIHVPDDGVDRYHWLASYYPSSPDPCAPALPRVVPADLLVFLSTRSRADEQINIPKAQSLHACFLHACIHICTRTVMRFASKRAGGMARRLKVGSNIYG